MASSAPKPGWYPDPAGSGGKRYWTGEQWAAQAEPAEPARKRMGRGKWNALIFGHEMGAPPYGWRCEKRHPGNPDGKLVPDSGEQAALARMRELHGLGLSTRAIAAALTDEGYPTKRGGRWASATVTRILARA